MAGFFDISGDVVKAAEAASSFNLIVPPTSKQGKDGPSWTELGRIREASSETVQVDTEGRKCEVLVLHLKIDILKDGSGLNEGRNYKTNFRINRWALENGRGAEKGSQLSGQRVMSNLSIARMKSILSACGFAPDTEDGGYSQTFLAECFPDVSAFGAEPSPLIGLTFWHELKARESTSKKDGKQYTNYDIQNVLPNP